MLKEQRPDSDAGRLRNDAEAMVDEGAAKYREHFPEFLKLTAEAEKKLHAEQSTTDAAKRIEVAEGVVEEFQIKSSGLVHSLLTQHKAGTLTAVRTELLAHLINAEMKEAEAALAN